MGLFKLLSLLLTIGWPAGTILKVPGAFHLSPPLDTLQHCMCVVNSTAMLHFSIDNDDFDAYEGLRRKGDARVHLCGIEDFLEHVSSQTFEVELPNRPFDGANAAAVQFRADAALRSWPRYHLLNNNCEHLARWVATGRAQSKQVEHYLGN